MIHAKKYAAADYDAIAALWKRGVSTLEIADALGIPKNSVCRMARTARLRGDPRFPERGFWPQPQPRSPAFTPPEPPAPPSKGCPLVDLEPSGCRYAITDFAAPVHLFCGEPQRPDSAYCAVHHTLCNPLPHLRLRRAA